MADDDAVENEKAPATTAVKKEGIVGPILGMLVVLLLGIGLGVFVTGLFKPQADDKGDEESEIIDSKLLSEKDLWEKTQSIVFDENLANVRGEQNRYIKCSVEIRVLRDAHFPKINKPDVQNLIREQILIELRSYNKNDLESPHIVEKIQNGLRDKMDRELRKILDPGSDTKYIQKIIVSGLIKQ